jgi:uncharacterized membrane protein
MKTLANIFIKGMLFTLPLAITFGLLYWLFVTAENLLKIPLQLLLPEGWYITGMGVASALGIIFVLGLLVENFITHRLFSWLEQAVDRIPIAKTIYSSAKDLMYFFAGNQQQLNRVVSVTFDDNIQLIGFVTSEEKQMGEHTDLYSVYFPMSYQVGGYMAYVPKSRCTILDIPVQKALQLVLTANVKRPTNNNTLN